ARRRRPPGLPLRRHHDPRAALRHSALLPLG
ncbi:MAG: hypothetical protein AVDCRST_MAG59-1745, partial [uncultured Thermomicrobiales bacterium]